MTANRDVLVLTVPLREVVREKVKREGGFDWIERPARYPSANTAGASAARYGRKSVDYVALAADVEDAARAAVEAGWETVAFPCRCWITRYVPDLRLRDALNLGQCEANALTRGGVWTDDTLADPITLSVQPGSDPPDRVVIVVQRVSVLQAVLPRAARPTQARRKRGPGTPADPPPSLETAQRSPVAPAPGIPSQEAFARFRPMDPDRVRDWDEIGPGSELTPAEFERHRDRIFTARGGRGDDEPRARPARRA